MSNQFFDRMILNPRERPLSSDINRLGSELDGSLRTFLRHMYGQRTSISSDVAALPPTSFVGGGLKVRPESPVSMNVVVRRGLGFYQDVTGYSNIDGVSEVNDNPVLKPLPLDGNVTFAVPAAPAGPNTRYDIIEARVARRTGDASSRDVLNTTSGVFEALSVNKSLLYTLDTQTGTVISPASSTAGLSYKQGVAGNPGTVPATTAGYVKLATILVGSAVATIDADVIVDERQLLAPAGYINGSAVVSVPVGSLSVSLDALRLPPGCLASAVWVSFGGGGGGTIVYHLYFFAGQRVPASDIHVVRQGINGAGVTPFLVEQITVDSTMQTALAGVNASPALKVAVGQKGWRVQLSGTGGVQTAHYMLGIPLT